MKPFVKAVVSGNEFLVVSSSSDGVCFSRFKYRGAANQKRNKINAAFESRLKEEMEKFRESVVQSVVQEVASHPTSKSLYITWEEAKAATEARNEIVKAILALPLFEEKKP